MRTIPFLLAFTLGAGLAALPAPARANRQAFIALATTARKDYVQRRPGPDGAARPETYVFYQGEVFTGDTRDRALASVPFLTIAQVLARNLASANYRPVQDPAGAELMIGVSWGVTTVSDDSLQVAQQQDLQNALTDFNSGFGSTNPNSPRPAGKTVMDTALGAPRPSAQALNDQLGIADQVQGLKDKAITYNANLLGFTEAVKKERQAQAATSQQVRSPANSLQAMLDQPRFFIILTAYDNQLRLKQRTLKILWTARLSVQAAGNTFPGVLPALGRELAAGAGRQLPGLRIEAVDLSN